VDCYVSAQIATDKQWDYSNVSYVSGAVSDKDGQANTTALVAAGNRYPDGAVMLCSRIGTGWYLPAYEELYVMGSGSANQNKNGLAGAGLLEEEVDYWSSTEYYNNGGSKSSTDTYYKSYAVTVTTLFNSMSTVTGSRYKGESKNNAVRCAWRQPY
jgi:hypothetical protein